MVVDQPATIGALPVVVACAAGHQVAFLPGPAMRRIADLHPGRAKTDARDAFVIADAVRSLPHTLRPVDVGGDAPAELEVLAPFDDDLAGEATRLGNRIRGLLTGLHRALEHAIGPRISPPAVPEILSRCGGPAGITQAGRHKRTAIAEAHASRIGERPVEAIMTALGEHPARTGNRQLKHAFFLAAFRRRRIRSAGPATTAAGLRERTTRRPDHVPLDHPLIPDTAPPSPLEHPAQLRPLRRSPDCPL